MPVLPRSALDQVAKKLVETGLFAGVVLFGDCAGLAAKLEAKNLVLERVHTEADLLIDLGGSVRRRNGRRRRRRSRRCLFRLCRRRGLRGFRRGRGSVFVDVSRSNENLLA